MPKLKAHRPGDWNVICDRSGFKKKASKCAMQWNGLYVGKEFYEERHPQDFPVSTDENITPPITRPEKTDRFAS